MEESSYTISNLTCRVLPGGQAREYTCHATTPTIGIIDILYSMFTIVIYWLVPIPKLEWTRYFYLIVPENDYYYGVSAVLIWLWLKSKTVKQESILAVKDIGVQVRTVYWGGRSVSKFIDQHKIDDIIINEGITMWQVKSYMAILVKQQDRMVVVFEHLLPRLRPVLLDVYWGTRDIIFSHPVQNQNGVSDLLMQ